MNDLAVLNGRVGALMAELEYSDPATGEREIIAAELEKAQEELAAAPRADYYVYALFRENGIPFYIGKGAGRRWLAHEKDSNPERNLHKSRIIRQIKAAGLTVPKVKIHEGLTEATAHHYERALITAIGRADKHVGPLVNLTDGGDGASGWIATPEYRARVSARFKGKKLSRDRIEKMAAAHRGKKRSQEARVRMTEANRKRAPGWGKKIALSNSNRSPEILARMADKARQRQINRNRSPEHRERVSAAMRGRSPTLETRAKIAASLRGKKASPETRAKLSTARRGKTLSAEHRAKIAEINRGKTFSPETRAKIAAANRSRSPEIWAHMAATKRGKKLSAEHRAKLSAARTGKTIPLAQRAKLSAAIVASWKRRRQEGLTL